MRTEYLLFMLLAIVMGCMASHKGLSDEEKAKLDSSLLQWLAQQKSGEARATTDDVVHVIIHTTDIEAIKKLGLDLQSTYDRFATARVRGEQLRQLIALPVVQYVEMGSTNRPQK
ncbi:MAG: hypothetical protein Q9P14_06185 [candidate division KSB1 bacterium]|nr:hypothetical protein [candidate division KSB1 bacterium]MDQ7065840.1 hypothetical protein [candidate division KSB1 bacterium]